MVPEPPVKRAIAYVDAVSMLTGVRDAFGYRWPTADPLLLAHKVCERQGWELVHMRFYVTAPTADEDPEVHAFWDDLAGRLEAAGVVVWSRPLEVRMLSVALPDGSLATRRMSLSKGITVRLALDAVRNQHADAQDVALLFSQEPDLSEVADEIRAIADARGRWLRVASAFPYTFGARNTRGIPRTDPLRIERALYESCVDRRSVSPP